MAPLLPDDADWAASLMARRRQVYAAYSPVFWRPARDATRIHADFLREQIASAAVSLRTEHGFLITETRGDEGLVDDFAIGGGGTWDSDGTALLLAAWHWLSAGGIRAVRVVTAQADQAKVLMLRSLSLRLVDQWWVKPVPPGGQGSPSGQVVPAGLAGPVEGTGFAGLLGHAPAVYDPGGPVLLTSRVADDADIPTVEREAAMMGAVLVVMPTAPESVRTSKLARHGWTVASEWYLGQPVRGG